MNNGMKMTVKILQIVMIPTVKISLLPQDRKLLTSILYIVRSL